jgi:hypothetical protein
MQSQVTDVSSDEFRTADDAVVESTPKASTFARELIGAPSADASRQGSIRSAMETNLD